jgi:hypothetical protein
VRLSSERQDETPSPSVHCVVLGLLRPPFGHPLAHSHPCIFLPHYCQPIEGYRSIISKLDFAFPRSSTLGPLARNKRTLHAATSGNGLMSLHAAAHTHTRLRAGPARSIIVIIATAYNYGRAKSRFIDHLDVAQCPSAAMSNRAGDSPASSSVTQFHFN